MDSSPPVGVCHDMCPERERRDRESQRRLHQFEIQKVQCTNKGRRGKGHPIADPQKTVKEYRRPAAGKDVSRPIDLRTPSTLAKTVQYLLMDVWSSVNYRDLLCLAKAYAFVFDRLRAVRQDLIVQRIRGKGGALVLEGSLGFLLCAPYLVRDLPVADYDEVLHSTQVRECFAELIDCYKGGGEFPRQAEFQSLLLLYDLGNLDTIHRGLQLPCSVRQSPHVCLALAINKAHLENNWVRLFRMVQQLNCLQACAFYRHLASIRNKVLCTLIHAYSSRNCRFPLDLLTTMTALDSPSLTMDMCNKRGQTVTSGEQSSVLFLKTTLKDVKPESPGREINLVEQKKGKASWSEVMIGWDQVITKLPQ
ncbi:SAC3 domain-containing protein 1 isoform X2 [Hyla sarda]|nr:SAC3 domain-containing protein 1 isoform X2 [Hyla sarda]XP_056383044.1 SAC3 domain-containing protein 1 isoform X2 [Hyla sarda]XP_056383045.1 SAC3 domain-containing protein 1 isoform X2 [Hyla sarda]XP_056383046.1 SAC3 domain-containing protein 1 isoform X2 [Hyla sarda]XP_056383047.1 SAC3 domain-containing protein 1 isoform X2 [Hyla sarda]XP_056383048.1 SAC3 domain-containing protein 1 isoform X2 [Hyla sarda]